MQGICPDKSVLEQYGRNELPERQVASLDRHLASCRDCLDQVVTLGARSRDPEIPDCHIIKEIGRGRFGVVYKAWSLSGEPRIVALKVLSFTGDMEAHRFEREIAVLKHIDSPGVVKCIASGVSRDAPYFVMDFVEGVHLDEYLAYRTTTLEEKLRVFHRVCRAVADAHAVGVVHRDLKPRNILVDAAGQPHILDFGICSIEPDAWSSWLLGTITHAGDVIGTLRYMSPEQAWGGAAGPIDERSDIWALGIMLYEIVTEGDYPYLLTSRQDEPIHEALLHRIRKELPDLPKLHYLPRGRDLEVLLERCLVWEPSRRISDVAALSRDIKAYCDGGRITTRPLGPVYHLKRLAVGAATRSRFAFAASFVAALGVLLWMLPALLPIGWSVAGHWYGANGAPVALGTLNEARDRVHVVGIYDDTIPAMSSWAKAHDLPAVTASAVTWRPIHAALMRRLARARPRAVVWDFYFQSDQPHDADLADAAVALEEAGVPVVFSAMRYDDDGQPRLSRVLRDRLGPRLRHGVISARNQVYRPGEFILAVQRPQGPVLPSVAVSTLSALIMPEARVDLDWSAREGTLHFLHEIEPGAYARVRNNLRLTKSTETRAVSPAVHDGDVIGCADFPLDDPAHWAARTSRYETLLGLSDSALASLVSDRVIVIGDERTSATTFTVDRHPVKYGFSVTKGVPGCYLLADSIAGLMSRRNKIWAFPPPPSTFLLMLGLGALATLLSIRLATLRVCDRPAVRRGVVVGLFVIGAGAIIVMPQLDTFWGVHVVMAAMAVSLPMAGSLLVEFARNRHRIADRARREIESLQLSSDGTLTLGPRRLTLRTGM